MLSPDITAALTNWNPDYYVTQLPEEPGSVYDQRKFIYSTVDELGIGQMPGMGRWLEQLPTAMNITIQAYNLVIYGNITLPRGDIRIYCKKLRIPPQSGGVTIDVSAKNDQTADERPIFPPPIQQTNNPAIDGDNGQDVADAWANKDDSKYGLHSDYPFGQKGEAGGTVTIICDELELELEDQLTILANGRNGYTGCSGQQGGQNSDKHGRAGRGGDAQPGGDGGDAGTIQINYRKVSNETRLHTTAKGGAPGIHGNPGKGGLPNGPEGNSAPSNMPGNDNVPTVRPYTSLRDLGRAFDEVFLLKLVQKAKINYLLNEPEAYIEPYVASEEKNRVWQEVTDLIRWIKETLENYTSATLPRDAPVADLRKANLYTIINTYSIRATLGLTFYGTLRNWVPGFELESPYTKEKFLEKYKPSFNDFKSNLPAFQKQFTALAKATKEEEIKQATFEQLNAAKAYYEKQYTTILADISKEGGIQTQLQKATKAVSTCKDTLKTDLDIIKQAIQDHFECDLSNILEALPQLAFVIENPAGLAVMGGAIAGNMIKDGLTTIKDNSGQKIDKSLLMGDIKVIGNTGKLLDGIRGAIFSPDGVGGYKLSNAAASVIASLDKFNEEIQSLSEKLGDNLTSQMSSAINALEAALVEKGRLQVLMMSMVAEAVNAYNQYTDTDRHITAAGNIKNPLSPGMVSVVSQYAMMYQAQVEGIVKFVSQMRRQCAYLTLHINGAENAIDIGTGLSSLWTEGKPLSPDDLMNIENELDTLFENTANTLSNALAAVIPNPKDPTKERGTIVVTITDHTALADFKRDKKLMIHVVPEDQIQAYTSRLQSKKAKATVDCNGIYLFGAAESATHYDIRVFKVQPRVYGAAGTTAKATHEPAISLSIKADAIQGIRDDTMTKNRSPRLSRYEFAHTNPIYTQFAHLTGGNNQQHAVPDNTQDDIISGADGSLSDDYHEGIGLFGIWTIETTPAPAEGDTNYGLELNSVTAIKLFFATTGRPISST